MPDLFRPLPVTSRRDQWRARVAAVGPARLLAAAASVAAVALAGWWLLRTPTAPVEARLPRAAGSRPAATTVAVRVASPAGPTTAVPHAAAGAAIIVPTAPTASGPPATIVAQVAGKVARPGVYHLPAEARVVDLIDAAGGVVADGDAGSVALAAHLTDGQRIVVPASGERVPPLAADAGAAAPTTGAAPAGVATPDDPVDLNTATAADLDRLPGVGPATAAAILVYREAHGPFRSVDDLGEVRGIGPARLEALRALVRV